MDELFALYTIARQLYIAMLNSHDPQNFMHFDMVSHGVIYNDLIIKFHAHAWKWQPRSWLFHHSEIIHMRATNWLN